MPGAGVRRTPQVRQPTRPVSRTMTTAATCSCSWLLEYPPEMEFGGAEGDRTPDLRVTYAAMGIAEALAVFAIYGRSQALRSLSLRPRASGRQVLNERQQHAQGGLLAFADTGCQDAMQQVVCSTQSGPLAEVPLPVAEHSLQRKRGTRVACVDTPAIKMNLYPRLSSSSLNSVGSTFRKRRVISTSCRCQITPTKITASPISVRTNGNNRLSSNTSWVRCPR